MLLILSPSKTQNDQCRHVGGSTTPELLEQSSQLVENLRGYDKAGLEKLMKISPKLAALNQQRFADFTTPFNEENARETLFFFTGDVYSGLDAESFGKNDIDFAQKHLRILSGLYGVLRPLDLIQPYRLEMGTTLPNAKGKNLYEFWGSRISKELQEQLDTLGSDLLINLASNEYFKAVQPKEMQAKVVTITFKEKKNDGYRVVAIYAKRARGLMANFIITNRITSLNGIKKFAEQGYSFHAELSQEHEMVFTRNKP